MRRMVMLASGAALLLSGALGGAVWAGEEHPGKALFEEKCGHCHSTERPLGKNKSPEAWKKTVNRMMGKKADWIKPEEAEKIADYLTEIRGE